MDKESTGGKNRHLGKWHRRRPACPSSSLSRTHGACGKGFPIQVGSKGNQKGAANLVASGCGCLRLGSLLPVGLQDQRKPTHKTYPCGIEGAYSRIYKICTSPQGSQSTPSIEGVWNPKPLLLHPVPSPKRGPVLRQAPKHAMTGGLLQSTRCRCHRFLENLWTSSASPPPMKCLIKVQNRDPELISPTKHQPRKDA